MKRLLFVCLGNICRSPAAEGVMTHLLKEHGFESKVFVDSAGTSGAHIGEMADSRMRSHAHKRGIELTGRSRRFDSSTDFQSFDYILVMDESNYRDITSLDNEGKYSHKIFMFTDFCQKLKVKGVPDPYYGGAEGFERVLDIVEDASFGLLERIKNEF